jgi:hypothetical protein
MWFCKKPVPKGFSRKESSGPSVGFLEIGKFRNMEGETFALYLVPESIPVLSPTSCGKCGS